MDSGMIFLFDMFSFRVPPKTWTDITCKHCKTGLDSTEASDQVSTLRHSSSILHTSTSSGMHVFKL